MNREELVELFDKYSDLINMGTSEYSPEVTDRCCRKALSVTFPASYKWFLNNYGGGDICGEEIYSIYGLPFDEAVGGDVVYQNTIANDNLKNGRVVVSNTDFGEEFFFDANEMEKIYVSLGRIFNLMLIIL